MLPRAERLNTKEFAQAFSHGRTARHPLISVRILRRPDEEKSSNKSKIAAKLSTKTVRAAFVVPKKQAKAAKRNLIRRRMRECYRQHLVLAQKQSALQDCDLIFVATPATHNASWSELNEAFAQLLRRAARLADEFAANKASKGELTSGNSENLS